MEKRPEKTKKGYISSTFFAILYFTNFALLFLKVEKVEFTNNKFPII
jgi:hypothetical protein